MENSGRGQNNGFGEIVEGVCAGFAIQTKYWQNLRAVFKFLLAALSEDRGFVSSYTSVFFWIIPHLPVRASHPTWQVLD